MLQAKCDALKPDLSSVFADKDTYEAEAVLREEQLETNVPAMMVYVYT